MDTLQELTYVLILAMQQLSPPLDGLMKFFTFLGTIEFYLIMMPFIYWAVDKRLGIRLLLILITTDIISSTFKLLFHQPRPYWMGRVPSLAEETSYGIPSSHASDSLAVWGYLAYRLKNARLWILTIVIVLFIGISRLYLGVHFLHDVLFGWLIGGVVLWAFIRFEDRVAAWTYRQSAQTLIGMSFLLSLAVISIGQIIQIWLTGFSDPPAWAAFASQARDASYSFTLSGALFGAIAGYILMKQHAPFQIGASWSKRVARYALGIIGLLVLYSGLDILFSMIAPDNSLLGYSLRFLRYAAVTFLVTFVAPWIFIKVKLADRQEMDTRKQSTQAALS